MLELGAPVAGASVLALTMLVGSKLFHVQTCLLYAHSATFAAVAFTTVVHAGINIFATYAPRFDLFLYTTVPWLVTIVTGLLLWGFVLTHRSPLSAT